MLRPREGTLRSPSGEGLNPLHASRKSEDSKCAEGLTPASEIPVEAVAPFPLSSRRGNQGLENFRDQPKFPRLCWVCLVP